MHAPSPWLGPSHFARGIAARFVRAAAARFRTACCALLPPHPLARHPFQGSGADAAGAYRANSAGQMICDGAAKAAAAICENSNASADGAAGATALVVAAPLLTFALVVGAFAFGRRSGCGGAATRGAQRAAARPSRERRAPAEGSDATLGVESR